jgi:hypothetical protein
MSQTGNSLDRLLERRSTLSGVLMLIAGLVTAFCADHIPATLALSSLLLQAAVAAVSIVCLSFGGFILAHRACVRYQQSLRSRSDQLPRLVNVSAVTVGACMAALAVLLVGYTWHIWSVQMVDLAPLVVLEGAAYSVMTYGRELLVEKHSIR